MSSNKILSDSELFPMLDDEPGPLPQLTAAESDAVAWSVVSRWSATLPGVEPADAEQGPARPLPDGRAEQLARAVTRHHGLRNMGNVALRVAAGFALAMSIAGVSFALWRWPALRGGDESNGVSSAGAARTIGRYAKPTLFVPVQPQLPLVAPDANATPEPIGANTAETASSRRVVSNDGPAELLERANAMRAQHRWQAAENLYVKALSAGADPQQRYVALVAAASLAAQHTGKPQSALDLYRRALSLSPNGDLSEEARYGLAESYHALGNVPAEAAALRTFLSWYPQSLQAPRAKQRLGALQVQLRTR